MIIRNSATAGRVWHLSCNLCGDVRPTSVEFCNLCWFPCPGCGVRRETRASADCATCASHVLEVMES